LREILWLLAATLVAFGGALWAPFHLDDFALLGDPSITNPEGWLECLSPARTRSLTWLTYWANYQAGGPGPALFHAVNLLLHGGCVLLLYAALGRLLPRPAPRIAAALFALHPVQTEAVVYVFARATLLMTFFCLASLRQWVAGRHWLAAALFIPALLSKEECAAFPLFLLLLHFSLSRNRRELPPIAVMFAFSAAAGARVLYRASVTAGSGAGAQSGVSVADYFLTQGVALWRYARLLIFPYGFSPESAMEIQSGIAPVLGWLAMTAAAGLCLRRFANARAGLWVIGALALITPSSSIFPAADLTADRRLYLPLAALCAAAGLLSYKRPGWLIAPVALLAALSFHQTSVWRDPRALWARAAELAPQKPRPLVQLARHAPPAEAIALLDRAEKLAPENPSAASEKGRVWLENDAPEKALAEFGRALALTPDDPLAVNNRGVALAHLGQKDAALADFQRALTIDPCLFDARWNLKRLGQAYSAPAHCRYTRQQQAALGIEP
jgi:tetratricopeptide (TPR) repeat protein